MQRCAFTPYEGKKPYIFVSYAHKDSDRVFPVLEELERRGYRIWYDDGIAPGSEWPENIAQHLDGCSLTLAFISPSSIASANCRREVTFALSKRKNFLGIVLQPTEMSLGMEMQLSAQQCIMKYTYSSEEDFYTKICSCPDLEPCLGQPKAVPVPEPVHVTPHAEKPAAPQVKKPLDKKLLAVIAAAAVVVLVLAIVLAVALGGGDKPAGGPGNDTLGGQQTPGDSQPQGSQPEGSQPDGFTGETALRYADQVITAEDVQYINQQRELEFLEMRNCVIQAGAFDRLDLPTALTELCLADCTGITSLNSIGALDKLVSLELTNCGLTDEMLSELSAGGLLSADISGNPEFSDLSIFEGCTGLNDLHFSNTAVSSVDALAGMEDLHTVYGSYTHVRDLTPLAMLTNLHEMKFAGCGITAIDAPFYSLRLEVVDLAHNQIRDLNAFQYCTLLRDVDVSYNDIDDVDILEKSASALETLNLGGNTNLYFFNLDFLEGCTALQHLTLDGIYMADCSTIMHLESLTYLSAVDCSIADISGLSKLTSLEYLNLAFNLFSDVSVLKGMPSNWMTLDLSFNDNLTDASALLPKSYTALNLTNIYLDPITIPPAYGNTLIIAYDEALQDPECLKEDNQSIFGGISIVGCPMDKIVSMEDRFGEDRVTFLQEEEEYLEHLESLGIDCTYLRSTMTAE